MADKQTRRPHACHCCGGSGEMRPGMICTLCKGTGQCRSCHQTFVLPIKE